MEQFKVGDKVVDKNNKMVLTIHRNELNKTIPDRDGCGMILCKFDNGSEIWVKEDSLEKHFEEVDSN